MIGTVPAWIPDLAAYCAATLGVGGVVALVLKAARPGFDKAVSDAINPRFDQLEHQIADTRNELTRRIDDANARLDAHMRIEELHAQSLDKSLGDIAGRILRTEVRLDDHLAHHPGDARHDDRTPG